MATLMNDRGVKIDEAVTETFIAAHKRLFSIASTPIAANPVVEPFMSRALLMQEQHSL